MSRTVEAILRSGRNQLLRGKHHPAKLRRHARNLRITNNLCLCGDEEKQYGSQAEANADKSPAIECAGCHKPKLRVAIIVEKTDTPMKPLSAEDEAVVEMLMDGLLK